MPEPKILIRKTLRAIDRRRPRAVAVQEVSALNHEVLDDAMEFAAFVALWAAEMSFRFSCAELAEVLCCAGDDVCEELHFDAAEGLTAEGGVEEDDWVCLCCHVSLCLVDVEVKKGCRSLEVVSGVLRGVAKSG